MVYFWCAAERGEIDYGDEGIPFSVWITQCSNGVGKVTLHVPTHPYMLLCGPKATPIDPYGPMDSI